MGLLLGRNLPHTLGLAVHPEGSDEGKARLRPPPPPPPSPGSEDMPDSPPSRHLGDLGAAAESGVCGTRRASRRPWLWPISSSYRNRDRDYILQSQIRGRQRSLPPPLELEPVGIGRAQQDRLAGIGTAQRFGTTYTSQELQQLRAQELQQVERSRQPRPAGIGSAIFRQLAAIFRPLSPMSIAIAAAFIWRHSRQFVLWARQNPLPRAMLTNEYGSAARPSESTRKRGIEAMHEDPAVMRFENPPSKKLKLESTDCPVESSGRSARWTSDFTLTVSKRPLPYRCAPCPKGEGIQALKHWNLECRKISTLAANDPHTYPPILSKLKRLNKADAVSDSKEKSLVLKAAEYVVGISTKGHDGELIMEHTGTIVNVCESTGRVMILTCSLPFGDDDERLIYKPLVRLANNMTHEGKITFVNHFYQIALVEISSDRPLQCASMFPTLIHGSSVFLLARNDGQLEVSVGKVLWKDEPFLKRNCYMYLSCDVPQNGSGGPVIDEDGNVTGMSLDLGTSNGAVLPCSIIMKCIDMQRKFGRIARPLHGLSLRTVEHLDLTLRDEVSREHNIRTGYLVEKVSADSLAEKVGIRHGDLIVSFDGLHSHTLVELEHHLLSLGSEFLEKDFSSDFMVVLEAPCVKLTTSMPAGVVASWEASSWHCPYYPTSSTKGKPCIWPSDQAATRGCRVVSLLEGVVLVVRGVLGTPVGVSCWPLLRAWASGAPCTSSSVLSQALLRSGSVPPSTRRRQP